LAVSLVEKRQEAKLRHAILGAGGIGGLLAAALARAGARVVLLMRPETLAHYEGRLSVESAVLGDFEVDVPAASGLDGGVDVIWVTTKATQLESALELAPPARAGSASVVPLLNGVDHVTLLRARYPSVVAGAIRVESERLSPARIRQSSPFLRVELAGAEPVADELRRAGIDCRVRDDELSLLWEKLAFLAPVALATTALDAPLGLVRDEERYRGCQDEAIAVARAEGARLDERALRELATSAPAETRSSMQKDVAAGRAPELDAIAGPIQRGGRRHGIPVPNTDELARLVEGRSQMS
jgi:2-dehydropantoate 2-reductase